MVVYAVEEVGIGGHRVGIALHHQERNWCFAIINFPAAFTSHGALIGNIETN